MDGARSVNGAAETGGSARRSPAGKGEKLADWADGRLGLYGLAKANMRKVFPDHWSFTAAFKGVRLAKTVTIAGGETTDVVFAPADNPQ
ncbi:hypothetical protein ACWDR3_35585, partial [Streptomyces sp. NPDC001002]